MTWNFLSHAPSIRRAGWLLAASCAAWSTGGCGSSDPEAPASVEVSEVSADADISYQHDGPPSQHYKLRGRFTNQGSTVANIEALALTLLDPSGAEISRHERPDGSYLVEIEPQTFKSTTFDGTLDAGESLKPSFRANDDAASIAEGDKIRVILDLDIDGVPRSVDSGEVVVTSETE